MKRALAEVLLEAQGGICQLCKREKRLEIDHVDGDPGNWAIANLRLLCHECNISERNRLQGYVQTEREKEPDAATATDFQYSAGEPKKHDIMREEWDRWVRGKSRSQFPLFESLKKGEWAWHQASEVADDAPWALGITKALGSSESYWRFIKEDSGRSAAIFEKDYRKGEVWIRYTKHFIDVLGVLHEK